MIYKYRYLQEKCSSRRSFYPSFAVRCARGTGIPRFKETFKPAADISPEYVISLYHEIFLLNRDTLNVPVGFLLGV